MIQVVMTHQVIVHVTAEGAIKMIFKFIRNLLTKSKTKIPLFIVYFNHKKYKQQGKENSCMVKLHPSIANDEFVKFYTGIIIDYVRDTYNLDEM